MNGMTEIFYATAILMAAASVHAYRRHTPQRHRLNVMIEQPYYGGQSYDGPSDDVPSYDDRYYEYRVPSYGYDQQYRDQWSMIHKGVCERNRGPHPRRPRCFCWQLMSGGYQKEVKWVCNGMSPHNPPQDPSYGYEGIPGQIQCTSEMANPLYLQSDTIIHFPPGKTVIYRPGMSVVNQPRPTVTNYKKGTFIIYPPETLFTFPRLANSHKQGKLMFQPGSKLKFEAGMTITYPPNVSVRYSQNGSIIYEPGTSIEYPPEMSFRFPAGTSINCQGDNLDPTSWLPEQKPDQTVVTTEEPWPEDVIITETTPSWSQWGPTEPSTELTDKFIRRRLHNKTTVPPTEPPTEAPTEPPTEAPTEPPTEAPTEPPTQPRLTRPPRVPTKVTTRRKWGTKWTPRNTRRPTKFATWTRKTATPRKGYWHKG